MITLQIVNTEIEYILTDDNDKEIKARLMSWVGDTKIYIPETDETLERQDIFNN